MTELLEDASEYVNVPGTEDKIAAPFVEFNLFD